MPRKPHNTQKPGPFLAPLMTVVRVLLLGAMGIDLYLAWVSLSGEAVAGCGPSSDCHIVLNSKWSYWMGIPVSVPAFLLYAVVLAATFYVAPGMRLARRRLGWSVLLAGAGVIAGAAVWFVGIQLLALQTICPYCMAAHGCGFLAAAMILGNAPVADEPASARHRPDDVSIAPGTAARIGVGVVAVLGVMVLGQYIRRPEAYVSTPIPAGTTTTNTAAAMTGTANTPAPAVREFQIFDGQFRFNLQQVPLFGRPDAPHVIVSLFDYTCHHCREVHGSLMDAHHAFSNELAIISLPMPLDGKCNPIVKRTLAPHTNACALARLGLAVWQADRTLWPKFDHWVFSPATPPLPAEAERYAHDLVGKEALERAATNRWVDQQIRQTVAVFEAVYRRYRKGMMPEVIIGTNLLSGVFGRDRLFTLLSAQFGLQTNQPPNAPGQ